MLRTWRNFVRLPPPQRRVALESLRLLLLAGVGLRLFGYARMLRLVTHVRLRRFPVCDSLAPDCYALLLAAVAGKALPGARCLLRSFTLFWLLRRHGIDSQLRIGVRKQEGRLDAHAWVELQGAVLNDADDVGLRYTAFAGVDVPSAAEWV